MEHDGNSRSNVLGDVQWLPNGNTLTAYSDSGVRREVDSGSSLLQELAWLLGGAVGYSMTRASPHGPPR